ncbi:MAG: dephospho-CoA kinase [Candidatus Gastranaerophilaceae bacterium]|nr:dephospho-CoA kinase [Candidatus Gastranaerophilaceae bacterium]
MIKIAITGNIASGKSEVQKIIEQYGYDVLDTDKVSHEILKNNSKDIKSLFTDKDITTDNGEISREKLGKIVFQNIEDKQKLENYMHPIIKKNIEEFFTKNSDKEFSFVGIPLIFEAGMSNLFDKIIFVYCDDEIREKRLIKRNNYSPEYAKQRMASQMPQEKKVKLSDIIIKNNGDLEELKSSVIGILSKLGK